MLRDCIGVERACGAQINPGVRGTSPGWLARGKWGLTYSVLAGSIMFQFLGADPKRRMVWEDTLLIMTSLVLIASLVILVEPHRSWKWLAPTLVVVVLGWGWACASLSERWHHGFITYYDAKPKFQGLRIYNNCNKTQCTLMFHSRSYPYFGSRRQHHVHQPVYILSPEAAMEFIRAEGITVIVMEEMMSPGAKLQYGAFEECLKRYSEHFRRLDTSGYVVLFEVIPVRREVIE